MMERVTLSYIVIVDVNVTIYPPCTTVIANAK
jgi:hypothetical protein